MMGIRLFVIFFTIFLTSSLLHANGSTHQVENQSPIQINSGDQKGLEHSEEKRVTKKFPTFHPLIVHFPIVLIIAAFPFYLLGMLRRQMILRRSGIVLASFGCFGALLAGYVFHPHTVGLTPASQNALWSHDLFASATLYLTVAAVALGALTCSTRFQRFSLQASTSILLLLSVVMVSLAGHYGAKLVHLHGVGPKGQYLVKEHISLHIPYFGKKLH